MNLEYNSSMSEELKNVLVEQQIASLKDMNDEKFKQVERLENQRLKMKVLLESAYSLAQKSSNQELAEKIAEMIRLISG